MHILVTRPAADADTLRQPLEAMGHRVSLAPMIEISFADAEPIDLTNCAALIATSRNGLKALEHRRASLPTEIWQLRLFAVGPGTAALARSLGFQHVIEGPGSAAELVPVITNSVRPAAGTLVHLSGDHAAFDLKAALASLGYSLRQPIAYRSMAATSLPPEVEIDFAHGRIDAVILMSPKSAQTFVSLVTARGLSDVALRACYICLSDAVARQLGAQRLGGGQLGSWQPLWVEVASKPNIDEILFQLSRLNKPFR